MLNLTRSLHILDASTFVVSFPYSFFSSLLFAASFPRLCFCLYYARATKHKSWHIPRCKCILYYLRFNFRLRYNYHSNSPSPRYVVAKYINWAKHVRFIFIWLDPNHSQNRNRLSYPLHSPSPFMGDLQWNGSYKVG